MIIVNGNQPSHTVPSPDHSACGSTSSINTCAGVVAPAPACSHSLLAVLLPTLLIAANVGKTLLTMRGWRAEASTDEQPTCYVPLFRPLVETMWSLHICSPSHTEAPTEQSRRGIVKGNKNVVFFQPPNTSQQPFTTTPLLTMTNESFLYVSRVQKDNC